MSHEKEDVMPWHWKIELNHTRNGAILSVLRDGLPFQKPETLFPSSGVIGRLNSILMSNKRYSDTYQLEFQRDGNVIDTDSFRSKDDLIDAIKALLNV